MADERIPAIKLLLLPKDTNAMGTIFGGVILSHIDLASAVEARKMAARRYVTKAMRDDMMPRKRMPVPPAADKRSSRR